MLEELVGVLLLKQLVDARLIEELEILQLRHLGHTGPGGPASARLHCVAEVLVLRIVDVPLALALGRVNPVVACVIRTLMSHPSPQFLYLPAPTTSRCLKAAVDRCS